MSLNRTNLIIPKKDFCENEKCTCSKIFNQNTLLLVNIWKIENALWYDVEYAKTYIYYVA